MAREVREPQLRRSLTEDDIPDDLNHIPKRCPREGCRSYHVNFRYFNNHKLTQPRYECKACKELFTLGGGLYKKRKANRPGVGENAKQTGRNVEGGSRHRGAQAVESGESSGAASITAPRLDLAGRARQGRTTATRPLSPPAAEFEFEFEAADAVSSESDASEQEEVGENVPSVEEMTEQEDASSSDDSDEAPVQSPGSLRLYRLVKLPVGRTEATTDDEDDRMADMHAASTLRLHEIRKARSDRPGL